MTEPVFPPAALAEFAAAYPNRPLRLDHALRDHPLLTVEGLAGLAAALPADSVEYNRADLPIGIAAEDIPRSDLDMTETIRSIAHNGSWMVLKRIEQQPAYAALLDAVLGELAQVVGPRTGAMLQREGFVFLSSPGSVTPFHFDPEHNILLQLRGSKVFTIFPAGDEALVPATLHERFHLGTHHRNLPWDDANSGLGNPISLAPGQALHVPVKAPHWVKTGPEVSISLSVTWRSEWSYAEADARALNHLLRRVGVAPRSPAAFPARNRAKSVALRALRKAGLDPHRL